MTAKTKRTTDKQRIAKLKIELAITQDSLGVMRDEYEAMRMDRNHFQSLARSLEEKIKNTEELLKYRTWTGESLENELAASKKEISQIHDLLDILSDGGNGERDKYSPQTRLCAVLFSMRNGRA